MRKLALLIGLAALSFSSQAQVWSQVGNTLQRQSNGVYSNYRFNMGSPGFFTLYSKAQVDSLIAVASSGVTSFNGRNGAVVPLVGDYSAFYPQLSGSYANPSWITSLGWSKIINTPNTLAGYNITDAYTKTQSDALYVPQTRSILNGYGILGGTQLNADITKRIDTTAVAYWGGLNPRIAAFGDTRYVKTGVGYVSSITGTANQVIASSSTGAVTLSLPQSIATTSAPQFAKLGIGTAATRFLDILGTTTQARISYDATHYAEILVDVNSNIMITPATGGSLSMPNSFLAGGNTLIFRGSSAFAKLTNSVSTFSIVNNTITTSGMFLDLTTGYLGVNNSTPSAALHPISTTEQIRIGYNNSVYASHTVNSSGVYTIAPTGGQTNFTGILQGGQLKSVATLTGAAGTDSSLVISGNVVKKIAPNYYATAASLASYWLKSDTSATLASKSYLNQYAKLNQNNNFTGSFNTFPTITLNNLTANYAIVKTGSGSGSMVNSPDLYISDSSGGGFALSDGSGGDVAAIARFGGTSKGVMFPRLTSSQRGAMTLNLNRDNISTLIYQTDGTSGNGPGYRYYTGAIDNRWMRPVSSNSLTSGSMLKADSNGDAVNAVAGTDYAKLFRATASGDGSSTTISIPHGLSGITSSSIAIVSPINSASSGISYVTTDATNVNIVYTVAPASGTNNLSYNISIKQ